MKFAKPTYDASKKVYGSDIHEGPRYESHKDDATTYTPPLTSVPLILGVDFPNQIVLTTKSWFSKPLTVEWLTPRIQHKLQDVAEDFEGMCTWQMQKLTISKEVFLFEWNLVNQKPDEKVLIQLEEDQPVEELREVDEIPPGEVAQEAMQVGPTRRMLHKREVLRARDRAARCLFKAERMTQEYCALYGEDTDWEDEDDYDSEDSE